MSSLTPNHGLIVPDETDPVKQVREDYANNLRTIDGMGGGHTIVDENGTEMPQEGKLQFTGGVQVSDDNVNGATVVNVSGGNGLILNAMIYSEEEKVVGVWTDGKPLYQRTYNINNVGNSAVLVDASMNLSTVNLVGFINNGLKMNSPYSGEVFQNAISAGSQGAILRIWNSSAGLYCNIEGAGASITGTARFTVQYTKTTDVAGSGGFQAYGFTPVIYSDTERVIGVWRDNKPLYKKTWFFNSTIVINANTWTSLGISAGDIENVVMKETVDDEGRSNTVNYCGVRNSYISAYSNLATNIQVLTLYYTKTTDVAGSGDYNTLGVPTVHYSTNEQVIGTYFGKPLYQSSFILGSPVILNANVWNTISGINIPNGENVVKTEVHLGGGENSANSWGFGRIDSGTFKIYSTIIFTIDIVTVRYTKTTD